MDLPPNSSLDSPLETSPGNANGEARTWHSQSSCLAAWLLQQTSLGSDDHGLLQAASLTAATVDGAGGPP